MIKRIICLILCLVFLCPLIVGCGDDGEISMISFSQADSIERLRSLDGKPVGIIGYMSTQFPPSNKFMYLMNLPYQSCPFCIPNTTQLSNTIAVYAKNGKEFEFTDRAILVTGTLEIGNYVDEFGYIYEYKIADAEYKALDTSELSGNILLWQQLASTDVISEVYAMYDYLNFLTYWGTYTIGTGDQKDYVWAADALNFIVKDGAQFNYGFKEGYFDNLISKIEEVDPSAFSGLVENIKNARTYANKALKELLKTDENGNFVIIDGKYQLNTSGFQAISEYSKDQHGNLLFGDGRYQYKLTNSATLEKEFDVLYLSFSRWLSEWEL